MTEICHRRGDKDLSFFDAFFGLITNPAETTRILFEKRRAPYLFSFLIFSLFVFFGPTLYHVWKLNALQYTDHTLGSLALIVASTLLIFVLFENIMLIILGVEGSIQRIAACVAYSLAPIVTALLITYVASYLMTGKISFVYLLMGSHVAKDNFSSFLPWVFLLGQIDMLLVLIFSIRAMGEMHFFSAFCMGLLSIIPLYLAIIIAIITIDATLPGSKQALFDVLGSPHGIWSFTG